jgi:molecular chaperone DnaK (HSP70)
MKIGIDLGSSNSLVSALTAQNLPIYIPDSTFQDKYLIPSVLSIEGQTALVGQSAEYKQYLNKDATIIRYFKRFFGTSEPIYFDALENQWFSESIAALLLKKIKHDTEIFAVESVNEAVITVPSHYNDSQRRSVVEASKLAGLELISLLDEPVAAALSYSMQMGIDNELLMIYDFGGGTLDLTVITKGQDEFHIIGKDGLPDLGGKEFDEVVSQIISSQYENAFGKEITWDTFTINSVRTIAENLKIKLSSSRNALITEWIIVNGNAFEIQLDSKDVNGAFNNLLIESEGVFERCLRQCGLGINDLDKVLMIGGTTKIPYVKDFWLNRLKGQNAELASFDEFKAVAAGAAYFANLRNVDNGGIKLSSVSTYFIFARIVNQNLGNWIPIITKNSILPFQNSKIFHLNQTNENQGSIRIEIGQSLERDINQFVIGELSIGLEQLQSADKIEVIITNKEDGTFYIKLQDPYSQKEIKFKYRKFSVNKSYSFDQQKLQVDSILINNI